MTILEFAITTALILLMGYFLVKGNKNKKDGGWWIGCGGGGDGGGGDGGCGGCGCGGCGG